MSDEGFFGHLNDIIRSLRTPGTSRNRPNFLFSSNLDQFTDTMEPTRSHTEGTPFISEMLKAYPVADKNSNKVELPVSLLNEINARKLLDTRARDKPMIFNLSVADPETDDIIGETHVGVEKFTAKQGTIGLPYKTALSLTKERGVSWLKRNPIIFVQYMELQSTPETKMYVQPRGKGFFLEDDKAVQLDIKTLLELSLRDHLVLTEGDWIPLFYQGHRFILVVKTLEPQNVIDVLNTDLTVELLPSEEHEEDQKAREEAKQRLKLFLDQRELRYKQKTLTLEATPEPPKTDQNSTLVRIKLPKGATVQRRFQESSKLLSVFDFVEVELYKSDFTPLTLPNIEFETGFVFNLIFALPGKKKQVIKTNDKDSRKLTVQELLAKLDVKTNVVTFQIETFKEINEVSEEEQENKNSKMKKTNEKQFLAYDNDWSRLADRLEANLEKPDSTERAESQVELLPNTEVLRIKEKVLSCGLSEADADKVSRVYGKQVKVIESMGYEEENFVKAVNLLKEKNGDLEKVLNIMMN